MRIEVLLFAQLKEWMGTDRTVVDAASGATVRDVADELMKSLERRGIQPVPVAYAVCEEFVRADHVLADGDRLALIPPVSGG